MTTLKNAATRRPPPLPRFQNGDRLDHQPHIKTPQTSHQPTAPPPQQTLPIPCPEAVVTFRRNGLTTPKSQTCRYVTIQVQCSASSVTQQPDMPTTSCNTTKKSRATTHYPTVLSEPLFNSTSISSIVVYISSRTRSSPCCCFSSPRSSE